MRRTTKDETTTRLSTLQYCIVCFILCYVIRVVIHKFHILLFPFLKFQAEIEDI